MKNKFFLVMLIMCIIAFFITNLSSLNALDSSSYVIAIGFDNPESDNAKVKLTFQLASPYNSGGSEDKSSKNIQTKEISVEAGTLNEGINEVNNYLNNKVNLSYMKAAIFSKDFLSNDITNYVSDLINNVEIRPYASIIISNCKATYFLKNSKPILQDIPSKYYNLELSSEKNTSQIKNTTLHDFYSSYYDNTKDQIAILSDITSDLEQSNDNNSSNLSNNQTDNSKGTDNSSNSSGSNKNNSNHIKNLGLAVFKKGNLVGFLDKNETMCNLIITNQFNNSTITIKDPIKHNEYLSLYVSNVKCKNYLKMVNDAPVIFCNVSLDSRLSSANVDQNYMAKENLEKIEQTTNLYLKQMIENYLYKTSLSLRADVNCFGKYAVKCFNIKNKWNSYDWKDQYTNSIFKVSVNTKLKSSYVIVGTK